MLIHVTIVSAVLATLVFLSPVMATQSTELAGPDFNSPTLGTTLKTRAYRPAALNGDKPDAAVAIYAYNGRWSAPDAPKPEAMRDHLLSLGLVVVMLDYGQHPKAVMPELWEDGAAMMEKKFFWACNRAIGIETQEVFVVPEGFTLRHDIHFYTSPDNGLKVNAWLLHPIKSAKPLPLAIRYNNAGQWNGSMLAGVEFRGYARAWIGHPYLFNKGKGIFPSDQETHEKGVAYGRSAVRTLRARAKEFNLDPERFVIFGASKHGNHSVWVGVKSNEPSEDKKWGGLHHDQSSAVQCVVGAPTWGFSEFWKEDKAPKFHEWMGYAGSGEPDEKWLVERSWTRYISAKTPPMAIDRAHGGAWRTAQITRLIKALDANKVTFTQAMDKDLPHYASRRGDAWHRFVDEQFGIKWN